MSAPVLRDEGPISYREAPAPGTESGDPVLFVHGFPESSRMWVPLMGALSEAGRRCVAPDLYCLGASSDPGPATFERNLEALGAVHSELGLGRVALVVHDWGGFVGLAWACRHPDLVSALVISDTGFFSDGRWHGMAEAIRGDQGEALLGALDRDGFVALLTADGATFSEEDLEEYWRPFDQGRGRAATLEFYRSMDFEKLAPYEGKLGELAPTASPSRSRARSSSPSRAPGISSTTRSVARPRRRSPRFSRVHRHRFASAGQLESPTGPP